MKEGSAFLSIPKVEAMYNWVNFKPDELDHLVDQKRK
jgi:hypothetical protein